MRERALRVVDFADLVHALPMACTTRACRAPCRASHVALGMGPEATERDVATTLQQLLRPLASTRATASLSHVML